MAFTGTGSITDGWQARQAADAHLQPWQAQAGAVVPLRLLEGVPQVLAALQAHAAGRWALCE